MPQDLCKKWHMSHIISLQSVLNTKYYDSINFYEERGWQTCGFFCVFLKRERVENRDKKKTWNKGENQEQASPILMVIWTDLYEPTYTIPNAPQI